MTQAPIPCLRATLLSLALASAVLTGMAAAQQPGGADQGGFDTVTNGFAQGERVVTEGLQKVRPGMVVDAAEAPAAPAAAG